MGTADLHVHTALGDGMAGIPEILDYVERETDLAVLAITEHDDLRPALEARDLWATGRYRFDFVVAQEVTAIEGHILALFIEEPVPSLQPVAPTLEAIHRQGGLAIVPHPMSWLTRSVSQRTIERVGADSTAGIHFDGIEASGSPAARVTRAKANRLNHERYHLAEIGASDAHFLKAIGTCRTEFEGSSAEELHRAILDRQTKAIVGKHPSIRQIGVVPVIHQQWRGMMATPRRMGWLPTIGSFIKRVTP